MAGAALVASPLATTLQRDGPAPLLTNERSPALLEGDANTRGGDGVDEVIEGAAGSVSSRAWARVVDPKRTDAKWFKCAFLLGSIHLCLSAFWLGSRPSTFYKLYSVKAVPLLVLRWAYFKEERMHYYMFDFCYAANVLLLAHVWLWPKSAFLAKVLFAYSTGPLALSVPAFGNSLVYHNLNELTGLFIHWYPLLVAWTLRWYPDCNMARVCGVSSQGSMVAAQEADLMGLCVWPMLPYVGWAFLYYLKIFVVSSGKIKARSYETIYGYMTGEDQLSGRVVRKFPTRWQPPMFMVFHFCLVVTSILPAPLWWNNFTAHSVLVAAITGISMWNGASFYLRS